MKLLLSYGADISSADRSGRTPVHHAALAGHTATVELLLENGADLDLEKTGSRLLNISAWSGHDAMVEFLLGKGVKSRLEKRTFTAPTATIAC